MPLHHAARGSPSRTVEDLLKDQFNAFIDRYDNPQGGSGPLAGLTVGVKANITVHGLPWTGGLRAYRSRIAERDAHVVRKLREAGATILGALNMEEAALGSKTDNPFYGATQNPHRPGHSPGGSSGGSAAAVAAGLCDVALGSDTMGSIRIPAAHCGVYGFKPATDRVSQDGLEAVDLTLDAIGPLARDLATLEQISRVISEFGEPGGETVPQGVTLIDHGLELHPDVARALACALDALPVFPEVATLTDQLSRIRYAGFIQVSKTLAAHLAGLADLSPHLTQLLEYGPRRKPDSWAQDQAVLARTRQTMRDLVNRHGFVILPTVPNPAFAHSEPEPAGQADFTCLANIAGLPALSLPAGWTKDGLPVGVQVIGRSGFELELFAIARQLDTSLGAYRAPVQILASTGD